MATPTAQDEFSFAADCFYVEVGGNHYRRATVAELQAHFSGDQDDETDHTNDWYLAQLKHYGLDTSSNNDTAKVRLSDAVMKGHLVVPDDIKSAEDQLKKIWAERDRDAEELVAEPIGVKKDLKRKVDDDKASAAGDAHGNIIVPVFATDEMVQVQGKKLKTAASDAPKNPSVDVAAADEAGMHGTQAETSKAKGMLTPATARIMTEVTSVATDAAKKVATHDDQVGTTATKAAPTAAATPLAPDATKKVGMRGSEADTTTAKASGNPVATSVTADVEGNAKEPQAEATDPLAGGSHDLSDDQNPASDDNDELKMHRSLLPLVGRYHMQLCDEDVPSILSSAIVALDNNTLWGRFQLGVWRGIMVIEPEGSSVWSVDHEFEWFAQDTHDTDEVYNGHGCIKFARNGFVDGLMDTPIIFEFEGHRVDEEVPDHESDVASMQREFNRLGDLQEWFITRDPADEPDDEE